MRKLFASLSVILLAAASLVAKVPAHSYLIEGKLKNVADGTPIVLYEFLNGMYKPLASDTLSHGRFSFTDTISAPARHLNLQPSGQGFSNGMLELWAVRGQKTEVKGAGNLVQTWSVKSRDPRQKEVERFRKAQEPEFTQLLAISVDETELIRHFFVDLKGSDEHSKRFQTQLDSIRALSEPLQARADDKLMEFMLTAPVTDNWLQKYFYFVKRFRKGGQPEEFNERVLALVPRMSEAAPEADYTVAINDMLSVGVAAKPGDDMVDGVLFDTDGKRHTLSELNGRYLLLDFWSQGCAPCRQSLPELKELMERYVGRLMVVGICSDDKEAWTSFLKTHNPGGMQWNQLLPYGSGLPLRYGVSGIPHYVLISPEGKILASWAGYGKGHILKNVSAFIPEDTDATEL